MNYFSKNIKLVLVEPSGLINLGSVARLCENFGVQEIRLVAPKCSPSDPTALKMAVKGRRLLEKASIFSNLLDAVSDCRKVVSTCGRIHHDPLIPLSNTKEVIPWLLHSNSSEAIALVFGREDRGLTNEELLLANKVLTLETSINYRSLNLSHAVAIVLYELQKIKLSPSIKEVSETKVLSKNPSIKEFTDCIEDGEKLLLEIGFLLKHTANAKMSKIKSFLRRAEVTSEEISFIRGILRQIKWAINSKKL